VLRLRLRVKEKPSGYSFLPELDRCAADQISIEAAQPGLDLSVLATLPTKTIVLGVLDLGAPEVEQSAVVARRVLPGARARDPRTPGHRARLWDEASLPEIWLSRSSRQWWRA